MWLYWFFAKFCTFIGCKFTDFEHPYSIQDTMRCADITYTKSENSLAVCWQAICENWCQFMLWPRKGEFSRCTKIPEVVILTHSLKLCAQWFKLLLRILPFVSTTASWNLQSMQYYGTLQVLSYKETPAAKVHSSHDPHSVCTESDKWLAAQMQVTELAQMLC